ncbi:hypothetical protein HCG51_23555 [Tolypothrix sp. PCC 7910]|uniref:hypothetical protein n=1 Tax=Tolypothrix sp. PCC 7910 TaxID=2099387 RepID=UPI00142777DA|nr:hypothetical protein [Tolypothrix sp. PCC 7910]QIR39386.1 hypothetical protein HCG51_23555 [Tolypothrix sp. PCC 7910]
MSLKVEALSLKAAPLSLEVEPLSLKVAPLNLKVAPLKPKFPAHLLTILSSPIFYAPCPMPNAPSPIYLHEQGKPLSQ